MTASKNLSQAWELTNAHDVEVGSTLYHVYHARIRRIADEYGKSIAAACGAFAALSPNSPIFSNFRSLVTCMEADRAGLAPDQITVSTYHRGKLAAMQILSGGADFADICRGPKITAFRHNLLFLGASDRVTIDGHMVGIMEGVNLNMREALFHDRAKGGADDVRYTRMERTFLRWRRAHPEAKTLPPCAVQAILWHSKARRAKGWALLEHDLPETFEPYPQKEAPRDTM
jgi:hypothetical protein